MLRRGLGGIEEEEGGKAAAKKLILSILARLGSSNIVVIGLATGLSGDLLLSLLNELVKEGRVKSHTDGLLWKIK